LSTNPLIEIRQIRLQKADELRKLGLNPYPAKSRRTDYTKSILDQFESYDGKEVTVAGRVMSWRKQGGLSFGHIQDQTGRIQLFLKKQNVQTLDPNSGSLGYDHLGLLDLGDLIEASGTVMRTQRGEISVLVSSIRMLSKALRPLPDQWSGLKDREIILRKRYLDTILDPQSKDRFEGITRMIAAIRIFLRERGFLEFNTPVIQPQYGGGTAKPFKTHVNALGCEMYLAISHELYLKRLIAGGYDKVFTIGRYFRNEGIDRSHHPEFSMVETMTAYENYEYNMNLVEELFRFVAENAFGKTEFNVRGHKIDFAQPWRRISMADAVQEKTGIDFRALGSADDANAALAKLNISEKFPSIGEALVRAFEATVEPELVQPTLVYGHPIEISPLAKPMESDPRFVERFEIFIAGMECGDNWSEQNDPVHLLETWRKAYKPEERESGQFHALDFDFIEALEYGLPPTTGIGPGIERMAMIFTEQENIDDVIFFPLMRPAISTINATLYGIEERATHPVEELTFTLDEFKALCRENFLEPRTHDLIVHPHLRFWFANGAWRATGHATIEGFVINNIVRIAGYQISGTDKLDQSAETEKFKKFLEEQLIALIREAFPASQIKLAIPEKE